MGNMPVTIDRTSAFSLFTYSFKFIRKNLADDKSYFSWYVCRGAFKANVTIGKNIITISTVWDTSENGKRWPTDDEYKVIEWVSNLAEMYENTENQRNDRVCYNRKRLIMQHIYALKRWYCVSRDSTSFERFSLPEMIFIKYTSC